MCKICEARDAIIENTDPILVGNAIELLMSVGATAPMIAELKKYGEDQKVFNELNGFDQPNIADEEDTTMPVGVYTVEHEGVQHQMVLEEVFDSVMQDLGDACEIIEEHEEEIQNLSNQLELSKLMEVKVDKAVSVAKQAVSALEAMGVSSDLIARLRSELN